MMASKFVIVETESGPVKGDVRSSILGRNYYNFQGIPYMKAPIGKLRFKDAQPPTKWTQPFDATRPAPAYITANSSEGREDAGVINIFTPYIDTQDPLPVLFWIHGGGFQEGSGQTEAYGPDWLLQKDVVLVSINYRLGVIGFLSLDDPELNVPGNAGLKDQTFAMKWVQRNISQFGGDAKNITLFGESAGGKSVHAHMISDHSKDLFHKAIPMSGTSFIKTWTLSPKKDHAQRLAKSLGWNGEGGERSLLEFLEKADARDLMKNSEKILKRREMFVEHILFPFVPTVEPYVTANTFFPKDPVLMALDAWSNDIPCMIGGNSLEGGVMSKVGDDFEDYFKDNLELLVPINLLGPHIDDSTSKHLQEKYGRKFSQLYFDGKSPSADDRAKYFKYASDLHFWHGIYRAAVTRMNSGGAGKTFLYYFDVVTQLNMVKLLFGVNEDGACHGDDLMYIFKPHLELALTPAIQSIEFDFVKRMTAMWTNFAIYSNPSGPELEAEWLPSDATSLQCFNIDNEGLKMTRLPIYERLKVWEELYSEAGVLSGSTVSSKL